MLNFRGYIIIVGHKAVYEVFQSNKTPKPCNLSACVAGLIELILKLVIPSLIDCLHVELIVNVLLILV